MEELIKEAQDTIVRCRNGSMDNKQFAATVEHNISTLLTEARKKWLEEEIAYWEGVDTGFETALNYGFRKFIQDQISRLEGELKALNK